MFKLLRLAGMIAAVLSVAMVAALLQPEWLCDLGVQPWSLTEFATAPPCEQGLSLPPGLEAQALDQRIEAKRRVVNEMLDGQHTLFKTAAIFRRLNAEYPRQPPAPGFPGDSDEERVCWQVIIWVRGVMRLRGDPEEMIQNVSACFEKELSDHKHQHGTVCLPDVMETE
jgi:hypothetical protein